MKNKSAYLPFFGAQSKPLFTLTHLDVATVILRILGYAHAKTFEMKQRGVEEGRGRACAFQVVYRLEVHMCRALHLRVLSTWAWAALKFEISARTKKNTNICLTKNKNKIINIKRGELHALPTA